MTFPLFQSRYDSYSTDVIQSQPIFYQYSRRGGGSTLKKIFSALIGGAAVMMIASGAMAASTLLGSAVNDDGVIKTVSNTSNTSTADDFGGISFDDANGTTFGSLTELSTDYNVTDDDCGWGSPRFQVRIDTNGDSVADGSIFIYMGPVPSFTGCMQDMWVNTGNLIGSTDTRFDLTQFGGPFYGTYSDALALLGDDTILRISLVTDGGGSQIDGEQEVWFDNTVINDTAYNFTPLLTPASKDECKNGGWMDFNNPVFKNQGDCVSYVQSNEKASGNKNK